MKHSRDFLVGIVFIGAIVGVGYLTVMIRDTSSFWGPRFQPLTITFPEVFGLEEGEKVRAKGVEIGKVTSVSYRSDGQVDVVITPHQDPHLREGCTFTIMSKSPLGGKYVEIHPGPPQNAELDLAEQNTFVGEQPSDVFWELAEILRKRRDEIMQLIDNLKDATQKIRDGQGTLGALIYDRDMKANLQRIVGEVANSVTGEDPKGLLHAVLHDRALADNLRGVVLDIREALKRVDTPLGILLWDSQAGESVKNTLLDVASLTRDIREGRGTLGRIFVDRALYDKAIELAEGLGRVSKGDGLIAYLIDNAESRELGRDFLVGLRDVLVNLNEGDGTIARLIKEPELYDHVQRLIVQIRESVEDAREQAPINQLVNMLGAVY